jgi:hypothetical protein
MRAPERHRRARDNRAAGRTRRVEPAGEHFQANAALLKRADQFDNMGKRPADPIEFPDHQRVALAQRVQRTGWSGPVGDAAAACVVVDTLAARALQRVTLEREVLLRCGHPHIPDQHLPPRVPSINPN